jgi:uncharacterized protein
MTAPVPSRFQFREVMLQPTSLCNLDCTYCYLPDREKNQRMVPAAAEAVATMLESLPLRAPVQVIWHCGEPLACGREHFESLLRPFARLEAEGKVAHALQTNGTLIDDGWCELFARHRMNVSVSLDGPAWANRQRLDLQGQESYAKARRGMDRLMKADYGFTGIAVFTPETVGKVGEVYRFFSEEVAISALGINIEVKDGVNQHRAVLDAGDIGRFWIDLYEAFRERPTVVIREFEKFAYWYDGRGGALPLVDAEEQRLRPTARARADLFPTVGWNGDVVFLAPEFLGMPSGRYQSFALGNVCREPLLEIIKRAKKADYVLDFVSGMDECQERCAHYSFCRGGFANNKFFENGTTSGTETAFCRHSRKALVDSLCKVMEAAGASATAAEVLLPH